MLEFPFHAKQEINFTNGLRSDDHFLYLYAYIFNKVGVAAWDHPLYIMMGHVLVRMLPSVDSRRLVNFISVLFGAASITLVFHLPLSWPASMVTQYVER